MVVHVIVFMDNMREMVDVGAIYTDKHVAEKAKDEYQRQIPKRRLLVKPMKVDARSKLQHELRTSRRGERW